MSRPVRRASASASPACASMTKFASVSATACPLITAAASTPGTPRMLARCTRTCSPALACMSGRGWVSRNLHHGDVFSREAARRVADMQNPRTRTAALTSNTADNATSTATRPSRGRYGPNPCDGKAASRRACSAERRQHSEDERGDHGQRRGECHDGCIGPRPRQQLPPMG